MKSTVILLVLLSAVLLAGCGHDRSLRKPVSSAANSIPVATFTPIRLDERWCIGEIHLANPSPKTITFARFYQDKRFPTFTFSSAGQPAVPGTDCNSSTGTAAVPFPTELPAGTSLDLKMWWRLSGMANRDQPWTLTLGGLEQDGKPLPDVVLQSAP
jgi:predicted small secreted protein